MRRRGWLLGLVLVGCGEGLVLEPATDAEYWLRRAASCELSPNPAQLGSTVALRVSELGRLREISVLVEDGAGARVLGGRASADGVLMLTVSTRALGALSATVESVEQKVRVLASC